MRTIILALLLSLPVLSLPVSSKAQDNAEAAAHMLFDRFLSRLTRLDVDGVVDLFAEDALFWGTSMQGLATDLDGVHAYFNALGNGVPGQNVATARDYTVVTLSDDTALLSGIWQVDFTASGDSALLRLSLVVARRDGVWKIVQFHNSALPE